MQTIQTIQTIEEHKYDDDVEYLRDYSNDNNYIVNKKSSSQTPFTESLKMLRDNIEALPVFHQTEVLRILYKNHITFSENKNGVFLNLSYVNLDVIHKISEYVTFVQNQESQMCEFEKKKMTLSNQYFK
jgi:signal-transduction protein with cAMP-binding, CBS, and nucleotidyltransferase domain